jgi:hypothetical protein
MNYLESNFMGKDCLIIFRDGQFFHKIKIYGIDSLGVSAMEYKIKTPEDTGFLFRQRTFVDETDFNLTFYPWASIHKIKIWGKNENT